MTYSACIHFALAPAPASAPNNLRSQSSICFYSDLTSRCDEVNPRWCNVRDQEDKTLHEKCFPSWWQTNQNRDTVKSRIVLLVKWLLVIYKVSSCREDRVVSRWKSTFGKTSWAFFLQHSEYELHNFSIFIAALLPSNKSEVHTQYLELKSRLSTCAAQESSVTQSESHHLVKLLEMNPEVHTRGPVSSCCSRVFSLESNDWIQR